MGDSITMNESHLASAEPWREEPRLLALVVVWAAANSDRVGEIMFVDENPRIFGRGPSRRDDAYPRLVLGRRAATGFEPSEPPSWPALSRVQLIARGSGATTMSIRNVGRAAAYRDDKEVRETTLRPGELLQIGRQLLLQCVLRTSSSAVAKRLHPFGHADEDGIVGESDECWALRRQIRFAAESGQHVLIAGASGSGKELVARAIHAHSTRGGRTFVSRNASTFPEGLIDAELFGNVKNYPNPGTPDRPGIIGQAHGSTLFLDEVGELPEGLQAHLLRVVDAGEYQKLGEATPRMSDFLLLAATNRPDKIKYDLQARLGYRIDVPELVARREDIPLLCFHILRRAAKEKPRLAERFFPDGDAPSYPHIELETMRWLLTRSYSTNTRELGSLLWSGIANSPGTCLTLPVPACASEQSAENIVAASKPIQPSSSVSRVQLTDALARNGGVLEKTWRELGLSSRFVLIRLMTKHGLKNATNEEDEVRN